MIMERRHMGLCRLVAYVDGGDAHLPTVAHALLDRRHPEVHLADVPDRHLYAAGYRGLLPWRNSAIAVHQAPTHRVGARRLVPVHPYAPEAGPLVIKGLTRLI